MIDTDILFCDILYLTIFINCYRFLDTKYFKTRALLVFVIVDYIFTEFNYFFNVDLGLYYIIQSFFLFFFFYCKCFSYIKSDEINNENVCLIFYKPEKLKQFLLSMFGLKLPWILNNDFGQLKLATFIF